MDRYGMKMLLRSIKASLGRYAAILAIVALGVGFYSGLESSQPAMHKTVENYMADQRMYDYQLMSTLGLTEEDVEAFSQLEGVAYAEGAYFTDALATVDGHESVYKFMSLTEQVAVPMLTAGQMPQLANECLGDAQVFDEDDIGKKIRISLENEQDTLDMLPDCDFTIVGIAKSPRYISSDRGSSSVGSGGVAGFVILKSTAFDSEAYHELLLRCDLPEELFSDEYNMAEDKLEPEVKELLNSRGAIRYRELKQQVDEELADARAELDKGWAEYEDGKAEAEEELRKAAGSLGAGQQEIDAGKKELAAKKQEIADALAAIPGAEQEIADGLAALEPKEAELAAGKAELEAASQQIASAEAQLASAKSQLAAAKSAALAPAEQAISLIDGQIAAVQAQISALDPESFGYEQQLDFLQLSLSQLEKQRNDALAVKAGIEAQFAPAESEIAANEAQVAAGRAEVEANRATLAAGEAELNSYRSQLEAAKAETEAAKQQLAEGEKEIAEAEKELEKAQAQINGGWVEYREAKAEAEQELADALKELEDAEAELAEAEEDAYDALELEVFTLDRGTNSGLVTFENDTAIVAAIAKAFPIFFVLIAALVCTTTMTRMINDERTQIGTLKAMGYSGGAIMQKYLWYSGSAALFGCVSGFFLGCTALPYIVWVAYSIMYSYTELQFHFSMTMCALCALVAMGSILAVTWFACRRELSGKPAELMRPKAPAKGRRILLEYIRPLWKRMSFLSKVTLRNAFRHPPRVLMMLLGIGGCTALMVAGFGAKDSVANVLDYQFEEISLYDMFVNYDEEKFRSDAAVERLWAEDADDYVICYQETPDLYKDGISRNVNLIAAEAAAVEGIIDLHSDEGSIPWPGEGQCVVSRGAADILGIRAGDTVTVQREEGEDLNLQVTAVFENYFNHYVYITPETLGSPANNAAMLCVEDGEAAEHLAARLRSEDGVSYVSLSNTEREIMSQSMASLDLLVLMLVVCSGALAFITIFNLTNINIMERIREIATVKVLGFFKGETASYILQENLLLSILGAGVGLLLGKLLHRFVMELIQVEYMCFDVRIATVSYILSFVITVVFALLANYGMSFKLEKVNMAESLKSVE